MGMHTDSATELLATVRRLLEMIEVRLASPVTEDDARHLLRGLDLAQTVLAQFVAT